MTEKKTKEVLQRLGFDLERAEELAKEGVSTKTIINGKPIVIDGKTVYSELAGARKYYFENGLKFPTHRDSLREEYYNLKLELYLNENKAAGLPDSVLAKEFLEAEIVIIESEIAAAKDKFKTFSKNPSFTKIKTRYLNWLKDGAKQTKTVAASKPKKLPEKWHALHYRFELKAHGKTEPKDMEGCFIKRDLELIGSQRCSTEERSSKGQSFYREFIEIDINSSSLLKKQFGNNWREIVLQLAKNDTTTIEYINENY